MTLNYFLPLTEPSNPVIARMCMTSLPALPPLLFLEQNWGLEFTIFRPNALVLHFGVFEILVCFSKLFYHLLFCSIKISTFGCPVSPPVFQPSQHTDPGWLSVHLRKAPFFLGFHSLRVSCVHCFH